MDPDDFPRLRDLLWRPVRASLVYVERPALGALPEFYFTLLLSRLLPALPDAAGAELCAHRRYSAEQGQFRFKSLYPIETTIRVPH